ncbi:MAG: hypothetical protein RR314_07705 [Oscillospiraceae bacterium]
MWLYYADTCGLDAARAISRGRTPSAGSAFAWSLLAFAARESWGLRELPPVELDARGKPCFAGVAGRCFSLSHTSGHVLAALSEEPVGADIEALREPPARLLATATEQELESFGFFGLWTLRESVYKLCGEGSLRTMRFSLSGGGIVAPVSGVHSRLYEAAGCCAAVSAYGGDFAERLIIVPPEEICT